MSSFYSFEKGRYGYLPGTIVPFPRTLSGTSGTDWSTFVPAGFLRCDGAILSGDEYVALKAVLGVGTDSKYRKANVSLAAARADGSGGQLQLPDLGSKYILAQRASGSYDNLTVTNPTTNTDVFKVGVSTNLSLNRGTSLETTYSGSFNIPSVTVDFPAAQNFGTTVPGTIEDDLFSDNQMLPHGHHSNTVINNGPQEAVRVSVSDISPEFQATDSSVTTDFTSVGGTEVGVTHGHSLDRVAPSRNALSSNTIATTLLADTLVTTTNLSVSNTFKMDDLQPRFILVEFLIKY
jgi:hypothetical protein